MNDDTPREYDRSYVRPLPGRARTRVGLDREKDDVIRFVVQLEYRRDGEWHPVVRYDHDGAGESEHAHDATEEGLHIDIYRPERDAPETEFITQVRSGAGGLNLAEEHLARNLQRFIERYEEWHQILDP